MQVEGGVKTKNVQNNADGSENEKYEPIQCVAFLTPQL